MIDADADEDELDALVERLLEEEACAVCDDAPLVLLGILGNTAHYRCRACGIDSHRPVKRENDKHARA